MSNILIDVYIYIYIYILLLFVLSLLKLCFCYSAGANKENSQWVSSRRHSSCNHGYVAPVIIGLGALEQATRGVTGAFRGPDSSRRSHEKKRLEAPAGAQAANWSETAAFSGSSGSSGSDQRQNRNVFRLWQQQLAECLSFRVRCRPASILIKTRKLTPYL